VRFLLTAGQKGDAPQAGPLLEGAPAEVVIADAAYDADHIRQAIAEKRAKAAIPNNPSRSLKHSLDEHLYASAASRRVLYQQAKAISPRRDAL
jgi:transposase